MTAILDWLNTSLNKIEHALFKDSERVEKAETRPMNDGQIVMISNINRITLTIRTKSGETKEVKAIAKVEAATGPGRDLASTCEAFSTEIMMYGDVLRKMKSLISEVGLEDDLWADCYHCGDNKLLFQDLCEDGYRVVPTHRFLDVEHSLIVMRALGKFHGLSMVMKERDLLPIDNFKMPYFARKLPFMEVMHKQSVDQLSKTMKEKWEPEWSSIAERLRNYLEKPGEMLYNAWDSSKEKWAVLNHGDFTMRNMLFHYQSGSSEPDGIKFVDFQMCHHSTLAYDLITLLYSSVHPPSRDENLDYLLETYVSSLNSTAKLYKLRGPTPSVQDVKSSLRMQTPLRVMNILFTVPFFILSGKEDIQKKADEFFDKFETCDDFTKAQTSESTNSMYNFDDDEVKEMLQFELRSCVNDKLF